MKKITLLILMLTVTHWSYSQCTTTTGGAYPGSIVTILNDGTAELIANDNWPNAEYSAIDGLVVGNTYTVTGTNASSIYITIAETTATFSAIGTVIDSGPDSVSFTATTAQILIFWHLDALCNTQASGNTVTTIQCTSPSCTCTAAAAPDIAVATYPTNGAIDVPIDMTDPLNPSINGFAWSDNGEATNYTYTLVGVGSVSGVANPVDINYTWDYNTTYTWNITSTNCLGTSTSIDYTFTTEADPNLSTTSFNIETFNLYPNPTSDKLYIKTDFNIEKAEIYNQLGKKVLELNSNQLTDKFVEVKNLNNGIYFISITANQKQQTLKFIKQ